MIIAFLGPPGSGKGTQAEVLRDRHGFQHFDTGALLRAEVETGSELGQQIAVYINAGNLVPIDIIRELVLNFLAQDGEDRVMFDGFPRSLEQAQVLDTALEAKGRELHCAIYLEVDEQSLIERIINRLTCEKCGEIYNLKFRPPKQAGVCDIDGGRLVQREDDTPEVLKRRLGVYLEQTVPVLDYYRVRGKLRVVDAHQPIEQVTSAILDAIGISNAEA